MPSESTVISIVTPPFADLKVRVRGGFGDQLFLSDDDIAAAIRLPAAMITVQGMNIGIMASWWLNG